MYLVIACLLGKALVAQALAVASPLPQNGWGLRFLPPPVAVEHNHSHFSPKPTLEPWLKNWWKRHPPRQPDFPPVQGALDLRVTRGLGTKGYTKVRVSVISHGTIATPPVRVPWPIPVPLQPVPVTFTYQSPFKNRWTHFHLSSVLLDVEPGENHFDIMGQHVTINLPAEDSGVKGLFFSDPCIASAWILCEFGRKWDTLKRTTGILNTLMPKEMDYWMVLGDNFYDQTGVLTDTVFQQLSLEAKSKIIGSIPGNHDYWVCGGPICGDKHDQYAQGYMQYYAQDTWVSTQAPHNDSHFLDFGTDPDEIQKWTQPLNKAGNTMWFNKIGNLGFIGYSGAHPWEEQVESFKAACSYFQDSQPEFVFVLGHWNAANVQSFSDGSADGMSTPDVYEKLTHIPGCMELGDRLKFQDGHQHCNYLQAYGKEEPVGFMIGASGMSGCGQYGFGYVDSTKGRMRYIYFEIANLSGLDRYEEVMKCLRHKSIDDCVESYGQVWLDVPLKK